MKINFCSGELCLTNNTPLRLEEARGLTITCTTGIIWITVNGEAGDTFLWPGQHHTIVSNGLALVESIGDGKIRITPPRRFAWPRWIAGKLEIQRSRLRPRTFQIT